MELFGIIMIFILSPLETFLKLGDAGTISKFLGGIVLYIFVLRILKNNKISIPKEGYILMFFIALGMASSFWAVYPSSSMARSITLIQLFLLYLITFNILKGNKSKLAKNIYNIFILFCVAISLYVIIKVIAMESVNHWTRVSISNEVDVNHFASFLIPSFLLSLHYSMSKSIKYVLPTLVVLSAILLTQSRGAFIAIAISVTLYLFITYKKQGLKIRYILIVTLSIFLIVIVIPNEFLFRIHQMFTDIDVLIRASGRKVIWGWAWQEFKDNPIVGIGLGNFTSMYRPPHSSFFQIISELGLLGLGVVSLFVFFLFIDSIKNWNNRMNIEHIIVIALFIMSLSVDIFYQKYLWIMLGICSSKNNLSEKNENIKWTPLSRHQKMKFKIQKCPLS